MIISGYRETLPGRFEMENLNIAIVSDDKNYAKALGMAILNVCQTLIINIFKSDELAAEQDTSCAPNGEGRFCSFDLILWDGLETKWNSDIPCISLVDHTSMTYKNAEHSKFCIYRYSPAQQIVSDIFEIYSVVTGRRPTNVVKPDIHVYAFGAATGGTGCTSIAMAVCQELMRFHDRRVMYVSLEELESTSCYIKGLAGTRTMGYYLYQLFKERSPHGSMIRDIDNEHHPFMENFVMRDDFGIEAFRATKGRNPLVSLDPDEICVFIESLMNCGRYDTIIIDVGTGLSPAAVTCMELAERCCLVADDSDKQTRETYYLQYLMSIGGEDMLRKMTKVVNKALPALSSNVAEDVVPYEPLLETKITIGNETIYSREGDVYKVLLEGEFGHKISSLTNLIIEPMA